MRLFVALPLEQEMRDALYNDLAPFRERFHGITWVKPAAMHITLVFLGEIPDGRVASIRHALAGIGEKPYPFELIFRGFGTFPPRGNPRVIFSRLEEGVEDLKALHSACSGALEPFVPPEGRRSFKPHVTVGRVKKRGAGNRLREELPEGVYRCRAERFVLYRSVLKREGPEYHEEWAGTL